MKYVGKTVRAKLIMKFNWRNLRFGGFRVGAMTVLAAAFVVLAGCAK